MEVERMEIKNKTHELEVLVRLRAPGNTPAEALHNVVGTLVSAGVELAGPVEWSEAPESPRDPGLAMMAEIAEVIVQSLATVLPQPHAAPSHEDLTTALIAPSAPLHSI